MEVPAAVAEFLQEEIVLANDMLPQRYAAPGDLSSAQVGFRTAADGVSLVGGTAGWRDNWWVIGLNGRGDPYVVDLTETPRFPVVFAYHGSGRWHPVPVADRLADFAYILGRLHDLEANPGEAVEWLEGNVDTDIEVWGDVCAGYTGHRGHARPEWAVLDGGQDEGETIGLAVVTDLGLRRPDVLAALGTLMDLAPDTVGRLALQPEIAVRHDRLANLRGLIDRLTALGATVLFDPDEA